MYLLVFPNRDYAVGAVSGVIASVAAILVAHPIDSVKVRLQRGESGTIGEGWGRRSAALLRRPYAGIGAHLLQYSALNFIRFGSFSALHAYFERQHAHSGRGGLLPLLEVFWCGAFSGGCIAVLLHPLWVLKTYQQAQRVGVLEAASLMWEKEGIRGAFRGYLSGFVRFPLALGVFFTSYDALKRLESSHSHGAEPRTDVPSGWSADASRALRYAGCGACAGVLCWTSIYPLDVVQSRMMGEAATSPRTYRSALGSFARVYREEGLRSFTRGYSAVLLRSGPVNAILLPVNDAAHPIADRLLPAAG